MQKILYTVLGALMLTACQKEATDLPQLGNYPEDGVVRIATQLNAIQTRVGEPTIYAGGNLSLSVDYGTGDKYTVYNSQWTNSSNVWSTATQMLWKNATAEAKIYAYAPFVDLGATPNITAVPFSVAADQSAGLTSSDLVGYKDETFIPGSSLTTKKELNIAFAHKLAKLKVVLTFGDQWNGNNPAITSVTIGGTLPTITYNAITTNLVGTASGAAQNIKTYANTAVAGSTVYEAIIIPQVVAKDTRLVTITLDNGDSYHYTISATNGHTFLENTDNTINLKIGKDAVTVASPHIVCNWTDGTPLADGEMELVPFGDSRFVAILQAPPYNVPLVGGIIDPSDATTKVALEAITQLEVIEKGIVSLAGIEYMTNLSLLFCQFNALISLDVSKNTNLLALLCQFNTLKSLVLSKNINTLDCSGNSLSSLDISKNKGLGALACYNNKLAELALVGFAELDLSMLFCGDQKDGKQLSLTIGGNKPGTQFNRDHPYNQQVTVVGTNE